MLDTGEVQVSEGRGRGQGAGCSCWVGATGGAGEREREGVQACGHAVMSASVSASEHRHLAAMTPSLTDFRLLFEDLARLAVDVMI